MARRIAVLTLTLGFIFLLPSVGRAVFGGSCTANKFGATARKIQKKANCHATAASRGEVVDPDCIARAETGYDRDFGRADQHLACNGIGIASDIETRVDTLTDDLVAALRPNAGADGCAARKLRAAGRKARQRLACQKAAAALGNKVKAPCSSRASASLDTAFAAAESAFTCATVGDVSTVEAQIDTFETDVAAQIRPVPLSRCTRAKLQAAANKVRFKLHCYAKESKFGFAVDPDCLSDAEAGFTDDFSAAEGNNADCLTSGDAASIESRIDTFVSDTVSALIPTMTPSRCTKEKLDATGESARSRVRCHAVSIGNGLPLDQRCVQKAMDKLAGSFLDAEGDVDCLTTGDAGTIEASVDTLKTDLVSALVP